jgi:hypothetical protein
MESPRCPRVYTVEAQPTSRSTSPSQCLHSIPTSLQTWFLHLERVCATSCGARCATSCSARCATSCGARCATSLIEMRYSNLATAQSSLPEQETTYVFPQSVQTNLFAIELPARSDPNIAYKLNVTITDENSLALVCILDYSY